MLPANTSSSEVFPGGFGLFDENPGPAGEPEGLQGLEPTAPTTPRRSGPSAHQPEIGEFSHVP